MNRSLVPLDVRCRGLFFPSDPGRLACLADCLVWLVLDEVDVAGLSHGPQSLQTCRSPLVRHHVICPAILCRRPDPSRPAVLRSVVPTGGRLLRPNLVAYGRNESELRRPMRRRWDVRLDRLASLLLVGWVLRSKPDGMDDVPNWLLPGELPGLKDRSNKTIQTVVGGLRLEDLGRTGRTKGVT